MKRNREFIATFFIWLVPILMTAFFIWLMFDVVKFGLKDWNWSFLFEESISAGRKGGIGPILVSTGLILGVCLLVTVPIGMGTAILLAQYSLQNVFLTKWTRRSLDVLSGVPSIVFGLFGNAFFCKTLGLGFSILSGGLTLACMALPLMIRSTEEGFRSIPSEYKMGIEALGFSKWTGIRKILLPLAVPGLVVGLVLGIGRALAETAALLFTSGYVDRWPSSLMDSGRVLSLHIYDLAMNVPGGNANAYRSAFVLVFLLFIINRLAAWVSMRFLHKGIKPL